MSEKSGVDFGPRLPDMRASVNSGGLFRNMLDVGLRGNWAVYNEFPLGFLWWTKKKYQHDESNM